MNESIAFVVFLLIIKVKPDLIGHIQTLDSAICQSLKHPQADGGDKLSSDVLQLFIVLDEIHDMLRDERKKGQSIVKKLLANGGLKLPTMKPNFTSIMNTFNWTVDDSKVLGVTVKDTVEMWKNIEIGMDIVPTTDINYALNPDKNK